jgi:hypothetical protein
MTTLDAGAHPPPTAMALEAVGSTSAWRISVNTNASGLSCTIRPGKPPGSAVTT